MTDNFQRCGNCAWWAKWGQTAYCKAPVPLYVLSRLPDMEKLDAPSINIVTPSYGVNCEAWQIPNQEKA